MIYETGPWRDQLIKDADVIERWSGKRTLSERRLFILENKIFLAAYAMRKLLQARKLSSSFGHKILKLRAYRTLDKSMVTPWTTHKFDQLYDFGRPAPEALKARYLLDLIIHSLIFALMMDRNNRVIAFLVTSDHKRAELRKVTVPQFLWLMRSVAKDSPRSIRRTRIGETEEWEEWRGMSRSKKAERA